VGIKIRQLRFLQFAVGSSKREGDLSVADIERVEEGLTMNERGVIDIERNFVNEPQQILAMIVIVNPDVLRNQPAEWIESYPAYRRFDASAVQFFHHAKPPLPAKASFCQIKPAADHS
jgi:hypothetical protein